MNKLFYGLFCFLFFMLALPASAQETPPVAQDSQTEQTEVIASDQSESSQTTDPVGVDADGSIETQSEITVDGIIETDPTVESDSEVEVGTTITTDETVETDIAEDPITETDPTATTDQVVESESDFASASLPHVFISEVNWAGSELSQADEWLEITNTDGQAVDLSGWILTGCATSGNAIAIAEGTMLAAGDTLLISNYDLGSDKTTLTVQPDLVTASISLSNSALEILLVMPDGTVVDQAGDGGAPLAGLTSPKTSMVRDLSTLGWMDASSSTNLSDPTQLGNPGTLAVQVTDEQDMSDESESDKQDLDESETQTDTDNPTDESNQESTCSLIINEFVSNPNTDESEWIEIYNPCDLGIDLTGWAVRDATAKETALDEIELGSGSYFVVALFPNSCLRTRFPLSPNGS
ncbi:MAG: hypothetical protein UU46_C0041G0004 [Candidatus Uhrbacteria bacterium GW2011_GWD1_41_16]|uniref:LTD domain-containing protein n=1 Tax=Candidatus Uhrbacteria bacterium GW2011_GWC1_41_20 TaxID=1618983 RepID=A0A0G0YC08_9BACT|nr:MAG: hypothetical protein UT52_C0023G0001 [Candidatus Uhrbacteria bacterium GW2011_GWE1_39_46]KKR63381.1 MAG: hypothetical protein UU04_C0019G0014 [Candidatus Uhrbacteria bacterium GW2011_GWC2_40_450]KKR94051.1 MAG: hypothetical protein UU46_C0041G0004 [Candidatus Uhrbacteria bacterium GW2011_GWD1_41_16]KKR97867.1 MAG: hypothetical protein UU50_C0023G0013 [Candidatus Uhrbacteria bacterium GW2011_GWC1_41_20]KKS05571.1 MAG: hypothetical protein UU60_C0016G0001 [Candidatus Uhrbacteria bacterium